MKYKLQELWLLLKKKLAKKQHKQEILIVEDEEDISYIIRQALEKQGYNVREAGNANWALEEIEKLIPHLIIMDVMMPGMNGMELCKRVKKRYPRVPVIMLTAKSLMADVEDGVRSGADHYIVKPFEIKNLLGKVEHYLCRKKKFLFFFTRKERK
jgi:two-component system alkaline phosphatase synthesis response regulator PhoP